MQANITGEEFLVNVIFQESWFNITVLTVEISSTVRALERPITKQGLPGRTVRLGKSHRAFGLERNRSGRPGEGEEFPERSPQQRNATAPVAEENLGDLTVGRETGWMPIPLATDDYLRLNGQDGIILDRACRRFPC